MKISIVIPNYNGASLLKKHIPAVKKAADYYQEKTKNEVEIVISDDHSHDNSGEVVKSFSFPITYLEQHHNLGFSGNVNHAVEKAAGEIIVLLNSDVSPEQEFLVPLLKHFVEENVFAVGCLDKSIERGEVQLRGRGVGRWERGFLLHRRGSIDKKNTLWASGGSAAFRKSIWKKLTGLSPLYNPFYWEDIDLSYRAQKAGYQVLFEAGSIVVHKHEEGAIQQQFTKKKISATAYRNQWYFVWLNITDSSLVLSHVLWIPFHLISSLVKGDRGLFIGFFQAISNLPTVLQYRNKNKRLFVVSDRSIIA